MERRAFGGQPWGWTVSSVGAAAAPLVTHWMDFLPVSKPGTSLSSVCPKIPLWCILCLATEASCSAISLALGQALLSFTAHHLMMLIWAPCYPHLSAFCEKCISDHCSSPLSTAKKTPPAASPASLVHMFGFGFGFFWLVAVNRTRDSLGLRDQRGTAESPAEYQMDTTGSIIACF